MQEGNVQPHCLFNHKKQEGSVPRRRLFDKPSKGMKDRAIRALDAVVRDPLAPHHAVVSAARALAGPPPKEEDPAERGAPPVLVCLPSNRRNPELETIGLVWNKHTADIRWINTPEGIADRDKLIQEYHAKIAEDFPDEPLVPRRARQPAQLLATPLIEASQEKRRLPLP
jgi:hypothetical protein